MGTGQHLNGWRARRLFPPAVLVREHRYEAPAPFWLRLVLVRWELGKERSQARARVTSARDLWQKTATPRDRDRAEAWLKSHPL